MAWNGTRAWAVGEVLTAANLITYVNDNINACPTAKVTTKGDITPATGANAVARLAVGSNDTMPVADSAQTTGWKWQTVRTASIEDANVTSRKLDITWANAEIVTEETTTSTSYVDLATVGPAITLSPGTTMDHLLMLSCTAKNSGAGQASVMSVAIAGAAALDGDGASAFTIDNVRVSRQIMGAAQATGVTHTSKYRVTAGTGTFSGRRLVGVAI